MQDRIQPEPPHLTVAAIIENEGRFLLVEEHVHNTTVLNQPAGHVEANEPPFEAIIREVLEETAWLIQPVAITGCYHYTAANGISYFRICYKANPLEFHPKRQLDQDILRTHWLTLEELSTTRGQLRSPLVLKCITDYLNGHRYPLELITHIS